ncbi:MAG: YihY family inner membrane protein [Candidatus Cloacimonetes bacterium]|nr:YihY family inner membrane protein [Candidatus Cloacimonadota bacterium]
MSKLHSFLSLFGKKFLKDRVFNQSASLTFVTLLGFVPFLIFLFFLIPELPFASGQSLETFLISIFVPDSAQQIGEYIAKITTQKISFNLFSFMLLIFTSYSLFRIINDTFDTILGAASQKNKNFFGDIIKFFGMCVGGVLLLLILISTSSVPILLKFIEIPFLQGILTYISPFLIMFVIFTLGFFFIPTVKIRYSSIFIGAGTSALIWIIFKYAFDWYIYNLTNMQIIFGVVSFVPIYLFWIYANWVIILSGVVLVAILDGRLQINESLLPNTQKIRIIIEKEVNQDEVKTLTDAIATPQDLQKALATFLKDENPDLD